MKRGTMMTTYPSEMGSLARIKGEYLKIFDEVSDFYDCRSYLCGGALRDTLLDRPVKDLDFFVPVNGPSGTKRMVNGIDQLLLTACNLEYITDDRGISSCYGFRHSLGVEVNIVFVRPRGEILGLSVEDLIGGFDFGINQVALDDTGRWYSTAAFMTDFQNRTFTFNTNRMQDIDRSRRRWDRISKRYPDFRVVWPE